MKALQAESAIEALSLFKSFQGAQGRYLVLDNVSLTITRGEFVSMLGPSGGGKSTLLNVLAGLEQPDEGTVRIEGRAPGWYPSIAYMQQKDLLLPWRTLWDNVLLAPELKSRAEKRRAADTARKLVHEFKLEGFLRTYPAQLSGGMRQRAALIRTLLCDQDILLLDEPFGALDAITRGRLQALLLRVWRAYGKTVLLVTHDVDEAVLLSDRVVVLSAMPGRVLGEFAIPIPQHARAASPETLRLKARILETLGGDAADAS